VKHRKIWIVDIDNTIADTWPILQSGHGSTYKRLKKLKVLKGMRKKIVETDATVIFLTARKYHHFFSTRKWLRDNGFPTSFFNVILVPRPEHKLSYLNSVAGFFDVSYFDDMSYNHENNEVKFYTECINAIRKLPITYYDYHYLRLINSSENEQEN